MGKQFENRKIIHIDMDAFYVSVELLSHPELINKPVAVGRAQDERGVISTANYEARKYGVHSALSVSEAYRLCPHLILLPPNFRKYEEISKDIYQMYCQYTDKVEPIALDECYLDVTGKGSATLIAKELKYKIRMRHDLTASAGVSCNKLIAKIASDYRKPDGFLLVKPCDVAEFIADIDIKDIQGVGSETAKKIESLKLGNTCRDLQRISLIDMIRLFGSYGEKLYYFVRGIDERPVEANREMKSLGTEDTFPEDLYIEDEILDELKRQIEEIKPKAQSKKLRWKTVTLKVKYRTFIQVTRSKTYTDFIDDFEQTFDDIKILLKEGNIDIEAGVRLVGVTISNFEPLIHQLELIFP